MVRETSARSPIAITDRLEAIASRVEAIARRLEAIAIRLHLLGSGLDVCTGRDKTDWTYIFA